MKISRLVFTLVISILLLAICSQGVFAAEAGTKTSTATVQFGQEPSGGLLTLNAVPDLNFGSHATSMTNQNYVGNAGTVTVSDTGSEATRWDVQVKAAQFTNSESDPLEGAQITLNVGTVEQVLGIVNGLLGLPVVKAPVTIEADGTSAAVTAATAGNGIVGYGTGSWNLSWGTSSLSVVGGSMEADTTYTSTLTWTLSNTP